MKKIPFYILIFLLIGFLCFCHVYYPVSAELTGTTVSLKQYALWAGIAVVLSAAVCFLEYKVGFFERFFQKLKSHRKPLLIALLLLVISFGVGALAELILGRFVFGLSSMGGYFNPYRFLFLSAGAFALLFVIFFALKGMLKAETAFAVIAVSVGIVMIFAGPFGHACWDVEGHYEMALAQASVNGNVTEAFRAVEHISDDYKPANTAEQNHRNITVLNEMDGFEAGVVPTGFSIAHLPTSAVLSAGKVLGLSFYLKECLARLANLLLYTLIVFLAIRKLKSGKMIFFVLALFPTMVFIAANLTYDWWVNSFMMLGMAYFLSEQQQPDKPISPLNAVIMCGAFLVACLPKQIYFPALILPFFLQKNIFRTEPSRRKKYLAICIAAIAAGAVIMLLRSVSSISGGGDTRGGSDVSSTGQVMYILQNPFQYAKTLLKFLLDYLSFDFFRYNISNFAYLESGCGATVMFILLIAAVFTDKNEYDKLTSTVPIRIGSWLVFAAGIVLVPTALYVAFTAVGLDTIDGCQPRYLMPLLITLLPVVGSCRIRNKIDPQHYLLLFAIPTIITSFAAVYQTMLWRMM